MIRRQQNFPKLTFEVKIRASRCCYAAFATGKEVAKKKEREAKESAQDLGRRRNIATQGLKKKY